MILTQTIYKLIEPQIETKNKEFRYITNEISWQEYESLLSELNDSLKFRVIYLDEILEILSPSRNHESIKSRIGSLLGLYFLISNIDYYPTGSTTFRKEEKRGGIEADESYCIGSEKEFPDLAIEVVFSSDGIDKLAVYERLGIKEVWFWKNEQFFVYHLSSNNQLEGKLYYGYELRDKSKLLPNLNIKILAQCINNPNPLNGAKEFRNY